MKTTSTDIKRFSYDFNTDNPLIVDTNMEGVTVATQELAKLDADGKSVIITDPYLFHISSDLSEYEAELTTVLSSLNCKEIKFCVKTINNADTILFESVKSTLRSTGCTINHFAIDENFHDRFWYCPETKKCIVFGTSLNGLGKRVSMVTTLDNDDIEALHNVLIAKGLDI